MNERRIRLAFAVYGLLALGAALWAFFRGNLDLYHPPEPWFEAPFPLGTVAAVVLGLAVAALTVVTTRQLVRHTEWAKALHVEFRGLLGPLTSGEILAFAALSGVAEELFFRGVLQPGVGLVI